MKVKKSLKDLTQEELDTLRRAAHDSDMCIGHDDNYSSDDKDSPCDCLLYRIKEIEFMPYNEWDVRYERGTNERWENTRCTITAKRILEAYDDWINDTLLGESDV